VVEEHERGRIEAFVLHRVLDPYPGFADADRDLASQNQVGPEYPALVNLAARLEHAAFFVPPGIV
jgi:hypothetical protein